MSSRAASNSIFGGLGLLPTSDEDDMPNIPTLDSALANVTNNASTLLGAVGNASGAVGDDVISMTIRDSSAPLADSMSPVEGPSRFRYGLLDV